MLSIFPGLCGVALRLRQLRFGRAAIALRVQAYWCFCTLSNPFSNWVTSGVSPDWRSRLPRKAKEKLPARSGCDGETWATRPNGLSGNSFRSPGLVRRAHVGELREQVFVGPDLILRHLSI